MFRPSQPGILGATGDSTTVTYTVSNANGTRASSGGLVENLRTLTTSATLLDQDYIVLVSIANITVTLPTPAANTLTGRVYTIKNVVSTAVTGSNQTTTISASPIVGFDGTIAT